MAECNSDENLSSIYHALRARRRRQVIRTINHTNDVEMSVRSLAQEIAAVEQKIPIAQATGEPYRNAYNALSQTHLPTLAEVKIIIYDPHRQIVSIGPNHLLAATVVAANSPMCEILWKNVS